MATTPENVPHVHLKKTIVRLPEKIAYGAGDMASCLFFKVFSSYLMFFYTDVIGLAAGAIGTMMGITRIFDAINDPAMGMVCDRTQTKDGKFRPWIKWSIIPFALSGILIFTVPDVGLTGKLVYAYITYTLAMVFYTMINIPYGALMGVMTPHVNERTDLASYRFIGAFTANLIVQGSIMYLVFFFGGSENGLTQHGYVMTMILFAIASAGLWIWVFKGTRERIEPPKGQESNFKKDFSVLLQNKPWLAIVVIGVSSIIWIAVRDAAILYYLKYYVLTDLEDTGSFAFHATWFPTIGTLATIGGLLLTKRWTKIFGGKKNAYLGVTILTSFIAGSFYFAGPGDVAFVYVVHIVTSFVMGPLMPLFWSMIADTADYAEWKTGHRVTGLVFSAGTFSQKLGWAIGPAIAGHLLVYYGYVDNVIQSPETVQGLRMMISVIPSVMGLGAAFLVLLYGINHKMELQIEQELADRKTAEGTLEV